MWRIATAPAIFQASRRLCRTSGVTLRRSLRALPTARQWRTRVTLQIACECRWPSLSPDQAVLLTSVLGVQALWEETVQNLAHVQTHIEAHAAAIQRSEERLESTAEEVRGARERADAAAEQAQAAAMSVSAGAAHSMVQSETRMSAQEVAVSGLEVKVAGLVKAGEEMLCLQA